MPEKSDSRIKKVKNLSPVQQLTQHGWVCSRLPGARAKEIKKRAVLLSRCWPYVNHPTLSVAGKILQKLTESAGLPSLVPLLQLRQYFVRPSALLFSGHRSALT